MDKDYQNFVDRMGSFEDNITMSDDDSEIEHTGVLGMKWGKRKGRTSQKNVKRTKKFVDNKLEKRSKRAKEWLSANNKNMTKKLSEINNNDAARLQNQLFMDEMIREHQQHLNIAQQMGMF